jgi:O-succinylbenzoate synthase
MGDLRKERIAVNEGLFRNANERTAEWDEVRDSDEPVLYVCECANPDCRRRIRLTREEYERVRQDSKHFAATQGHQIADAETVIEDNGDWVVIEKHDDVAETVRAMDQRSD